MKTHIRHYRRILSLAAELPILPSSILADDHGGTAATATAWNTPDIAGNIESAADADWFRFSAQRNTQHRRIARRTDSACGARASL
jgi:hypothetical protein